MLKNFKLSIERDLLYPSMACYQMDLGPAVNAAIDAGLVEGEMKELPSWTKFVANPYKAKGFFVNILQSIFEGKGNYDELNVDIQTNRAEREMLGENDGRRIAMMFLPGNTKNDTQSPIANIAREALRGYAVIEVNGDHMKGEDAEKKVKEFIKENSDKSILILAAKMAQRSFSVGDIDELYLAYDNGENSSTIQKMSRALTPKSKTKIGKIFSLSFDPNRDDKLDQVLIESALNLANRSEEGTDIRAELQRILKTVDIFSCTDDGAIPIMIDKFIEGAFKRKSIGKVIANKVNITSLPKDIIKALADGNIAYLQKTKREIVQSGKTKDLVSQLKDNTKSDSNKKSLSDKEIEDAKAQIDTIMNNSDILIFGTGMSNIKSALKYIKENNQQNIIEDEFNVKFEFIEFLFEENFIKQEWVDLMYKI